MDFSYFAICNKMLQQDLYYIEFVFNGSDIRGAVWLFQGGFFTPCH